MAWIEETQKRLNEVYIVQLCTMYSLQCICDCRFSNVLPYSVRVRK